MAISEAATSGVVAGSVPVLDAQAAELKAERLWGMADAEKPREVQEVSRFAVCSVFFFR